MAIPVAAIDIHMTSSNIIPGLGVPVFIDIVRTIRPTHIIQLLSDATPSSKGHEELPPLTQQYLSSATAWTLNSDHAPKPQKLVSDIGLLSSVNTKFTGTSRLRGVTFDMPIEVSEEEEVDDEVGETTDKESAIEVSSWNSTEKSRNTTDTGTENSEPIRGWSKGPEYDIYVLRVSKLKTKS